MCFRFFLLGFILCIASYHLIINLGRQKERVDLSMGLFYLTMGSLFFLRRIYVDYINPSSYTINTFFFPLLCYMVAFSLSFMVVSLLEAKEKKEVNFIYILLGVLACILGLCLALQHLGGFSALRFFFIALGIYTITGAGIFISLFIRSWKNLPGYMRKRIYAVFLLTLLYALASFMEIFNNRISPEVYNFLFNCLMIMIILSLFALSYIRIYIFNKEHNDLVSLKDSLEDLVAKRTFQLEEEINKRTSYFINLAHEMKTPLTLVQLYLGKFREEGKKEDLDILGLNIRKILRDMENFLDIEKLKRGQLYYDHNQVTNFSSLLNESVQLFAEGARKKGVVLNSRIEENLYIKMEPFALDRVINNLLDNALKYNPPGSEVDVFLERRSDQIIFQVKDEGPGIPLDQQELIFQPFKQLEREKQNVQGIGMGLHIVEQILKTAKGRIVVDSEEGKGALFTVTFPVWKEVYSESVITPRGPGILPYPYVPEMPDKIISSRPGILVVEDNRHLLLHLREILSRDYCVFTAESGVRALEMVDSLSPLNLIISDIMMDGMDGFHFIETLRDEKKRDIPLIFLTARSSLDDKLRGLSLGAVDYIFKPFREDELLLKVSSLLRLEKIREALFQEQKQAAFGRLVAGLTHEVLNPLTGIKGPISLLESRCEGKDEKEIFRFVYENINRIEEIIKSARLLGAGSLTSMEEVNLKEFFDALLKVIRKERRDRIRIEVQMEENLSVFSHRRGLSHIFLNLMNNALDALENRNRGGWIYCRGKREGDKIIIEIEDNGVGILPENINLIYDLYFTTRETGQASGLGLFVVKDILKKLGGKIEVESEASRGTLFRVILKDEENEVKNSCC